MHLVGKDSIIVGIDVHKYSHQAIALGCFGQIPPDLVVKTQAIDIVEIIL
jgi:hypothetical protein